MIWCFVLKVTKIGIFSSQLVSLSCISFFYWFFNSDCFAKSLILNSIICLQNSNELIVVSLKAQLCRLRYECKHKVGLEKSKGVQLISNITSNLTKNLYYS